MMKFNRIISFVLIALILLTVMPVSILAAESCEHEWGEWKTITPATCSKTGIEERVCKKNPAHIERRAAPINEDAHNWLLIGKVSPSCFESGKLTYACINNPDHIKEETVPATGHIWEDWQPAKIPTCIAKGQEIRFCKNTSLHYELREVDVDPNGHLWTEWEVEIPATDEASGVEVRTCMWDSSHVERRKVTMFGELMGDMDSDSEITVTDALAALRIAAKLSEATEGDMRRGDMDGDKQVTVTDALAILRIAARLV